MGRRREGGVWREGKEGPSCGPWGPWGLLGSSRAVPGGSWVVLGGSRGGPWGLPGAAWEFLGAPQGVLGCLWGFGGARGAKTDDSWDLFLGLLASSLAVERATGEKSVDRLTCLPGGPNRRFWGPLLGPPGKQFHCRKKDRPRRTPAGGNTGPRDHLTFRGCPNSRVQSTETSTWDQRIHIPGKS